VRTKRKLPRGEGCKVYGFGKEQRYVARSDTDHGLVSFLEKKNRRAKEVRGAFRARGRLLYHTRFSPKATSYRQTSEASILINQGTSA
jgi:hypothetical protein